MSVPMDDTDRLVGEAMRIVDENAGLRVRVTALEDALSALVALKDGPRDAHYAEWKPKAWDHARKVLEVGK